MKQELQSLIRKWQCLAVPFPFLTKTSGPCVTYLTILDSVFKNYFNNIYFSFSTSVTSPHPMWGMDKCRIVMVLLGLLALLCFTVS